MPKGVSSKYRLLWTVIAFALIMLGVVCSAYLLMRHLSLASGSPDAFDICGALLGRNCHDAIQSDIAVQLGIPLGGWGLVHFAVVSVLLLLSLALGETFRMEGTVAAIFMCIVATIMGAALTGMMFTGAAALCLFCVVIHTVNLLLIPVVLVASGQTVGKLCSALGQGIKYIFGASSNDPVLTRWKIIGFVTAALVGVVTYQWVLIQTDRQTQTTSAPPTFDEVLTAFKEEPVQDIPVGDEDPWFGDKNAPARIVMFSDFQCPACKGFAHGLQHLREDHPEVSLVFKHFPLSSQCNSEINSDMHPLSCGGAYAAEAARRQGKFWEYHDAVFASSEQLDDVVLRKIATEVGLDMIQFEADVAAEEIKDKVTTDVALGNEMKIRGTPTIFLNGKRLSRYGKASLEQLIKHASGQGRE